VDSRINQGFSDMRLGNSPYASNNQSTASIHNTLQTQRNPRPGLENLSVHRISNGYQPSAERVPEPKMGKTAPAITGPATGHIARAAEPTKGQAWAFPEEEGQAPSNYGDSRRSSITDSIASSQFTQESRLPPGQRRLEETNEYARLSNASGEYPPVHHHTMQHKQLGELQAEEGMGPGSQPYSRTPELRVSHKLAERKRRTEMKELFDQLRDLMPQERGSKASKWEILTKAIAEHQKQSEHLRVLQTHYSTACTENEMLRREVQGLRMESAQLRGELGASTPHAQPQHSAGPGPAPQPPAYTPDHYAANNRPEQLPPLRSISNSVPSAPESMTGVQYEAPRTNGYRPERYWAGQNDLNNIPCLSSTYDTHFDISFVNNYKSTIWMTPERCDGNGLVVCLHLDTHSHMRGNTLAKPGTTNGSRASCVIRAPWWKPTTIFSTIVQSPNGLFGLWFASSFFFLFFFAIFFFLVAVLDGFVVSCLVVDLHAASRGRRED
jgi:hypothetical protein